MPEWLNIRKIVSRSLSAILDFFRGVWAKIRRVIDNLSPSRRKLLGSLFAVFFVLFAALQARTVGFQALGRAIRMSEYKAVWKQSEVDVLKNSSFPGALVIDWARNNLPDDSKFLVYRQAEFAYYVKSDWIYDFDPAIIDMYSMETREEVHEYLLEHDITHIFVPNYMMSTLYNSPVADIIGDPTYSREVYTHDGMRLYELYKKPRAWTCVPQPGLENWVQGIIGANVTFEAGGRGLFGAQIERAVPRTFTLFVEKGSVFTGRTSTPLGATRLEDGAMLTAWPDNYLDRIGLMSGFGPIYLAPKTKIEPNAIRDITVDFDIEGEGFFEFWVYQYDVNGVWRSRRIWDAVVKDEGETKRVAVQIQLADETRSYRIMMTNGGTAAGYAKIKGVKACGVKEVLEGANEGVLSIPSEEVLAKHIETSVQEVNNSDQAILDNLHMDPVVIAPQSPNGNLFKEWDLTPFNSEFASKTEGSRLAIGNRCDVFELFCRQLDPEGVTEMLVLRPFKQNGFTLNMPINSGFTIHTGKKITNLRTWWQCSIGRRVWFLERSPAREGYFERIFLKFAKWVIPTGKSKTDELSKLRMLDFDSKNNTVVSSNVYWLDGKGRKNCYFLGEQAIETEGADLTWDFPIPKGASDLNFSITSRHALNQYSNFSVSGAEIQVRNN